MPRSFSPREASVIVGCSLASIQKAFASKNLPAGAASKGKARLLTEQAVLALALSKTFVGGPRVSWAAAATALAKAGVEGREKAKGVIDVGQGASADLSSRLSKTIDRMDLLERGARLAKGKPAGNVAGTSISLSAIAEQLAAKRPFDDIAKVFPELSPEDVAAINIHFSAAPQRGRPVSTATTAVAVPGTRDIAAWSKTMQITAGQVEHWSTNPQARTELPRLIRRLILSDSPEAAIDMPSGESVDFSGWDGVVRTKKEASWVPNGQSYWELSTEAKPSAKATDDYKKRTAETPKAVRAKSTLVVATGRRWPNKQKWISARLAEKQWKDVRAYDANDLEFQLSRSPAIALQFADEIGLMGHGVESVQRFWATWAAQSDPTITIDALKADRAKAASSLSELLVARVKAESASPIRIRADSVEEAAAFAAGGIIEADISSKSLVVTEANGWRFVEQNPLVKVALVSRPEFAERPTIRKGLVVVIPYATGDMEGQFRGTSSGEPDVILPRPKVHEFEQAVVALGVEEGDAARLANLSGRSWSIFRRLRSKNSALRSPAWLQRPESDALSVVCLVGSWSAASEADKKLVERVAGQRYEDIEKKLRALAQLDDAPVIEIGQVWKAKSSLELLSLYGPRLTNGEVDRFFEIAREVLFANDPALELKDEDRFAASIYGKVRPESGLMIKAIGDTLIKLAVRGPTVPTLDNARIAQRVDGFVAELLDDANGERWLSLNSGLPDLAEASPSAFLRAVQKGLNRPDGVRRLLTESKSSGFGGRCWHAGLLWALECLAWAPERLDEIVVILAKLCEIPITGNWGNSPKSTLMDIFREWNPQTAANIDQRIRALDVLEKASPGIAFSIANKLIRIGPDSATPAYRPRWRDEDAGAGRGAPNSEQLAMRIAGAEKAFVLAQGDAERTSRLIEKLEAFDEPRIKRVIALAEDASKVSTQSRDVVRAAVRSLLNKLRNYGRDGKNPALRLADLDALYKRIEPLDLVDRDLWLFAEQWPNLPFKVDEDKKYLRGDILDETRAKSLEQILKAQGEAGVTALALKAAQYGIVGRTYARVLSDRDQIARWILANTVDLSPQDPFTKTAINALWGFEPAQSLLAIRAILQSADNWPPEQKARLLVGARFDRAVWDLAAELGEDVNDIYWRQCSPWPMHKEPLEDVEFVTRKLLSISRPRTAFYASHYAAKRLDTSLLMDILEAVLSVDESAAALPSSYDLTETIEVLENAPSVDHKRLARLEFALIRALGFDNEQVAKTLYKQIAGSPDLFVELLTAAFKPRNASHDEEQSGNENAARSAYHVLDHFRSMPGEADGKVDAAAFASFVDEGLRQAMAVDRREIFEIIFGHAIAYAPKDEDGHFPCRAVCETVNRPELVDMRRGLRTGLFNKRGATMRSPFDGGDQERALAQQYRERANVLRGQYTNVANVMDDLARGYEDDAKREDISARLRAESP